MFTKKTILQVFSVLLVVILIGGAAFPISVRAASIITVNSTADNTTADGACTLREAITNANDNAATYGDCIAGSGNDTIFFHNSLGTAVITLGSQLPNITYGGSGLTIDGDNRITLSGNDSVRVFFVNSSALLTLQNISVTHGSATDGGGLFNYGTVTIIHSEFSNNSATRGGGVANSNVSATLTISHSAFSNNSASSDGGGILNVGTLTIANSTFSNNSANYGGGMSNSSGTATLLNSTFSGNSATGWGGGVSTWNGGGTAPITTIRNTILANSISSSDCWNHDVGGAVLIGGNNIIETTSTCNSIATIASDPNLGILTGSPAYFPLNAGSPAIDAGNDAICADSPVSDTSQNGLTRPQGAHCDIGSYERVVAALSVVSSVRANLNPSNALSVKFIVTFSQPVFNVDTSDFILTSSGSISGAAVSGVSGAGNSYTVTVNTGSGSGTLRLDVVDDNSIVDTASNPLGGAAMGDGNFTSGETYDIDKTAPTVLSVVRTNTNPNSLSSVNFTVTFTEPVTGVNIVAPFDDFALTTSTGISDASIAYVIGSGKTYTVKVNTGTGNGTIRLDVPDSATITDLVGNPLAGLPYTGGETYTVEKICLISLPLIVR